MKIEEIKEWSLFAFCIFGIGGKILEIKWMIIVGSILFWRYFLSVFYLIWAHHKKVGQLKPALKKYSGDLFVLGVPILLLLAKIVMLICS